MGRLAAVMVTVAVLSACQSNAQPVATPSPSPSPHTTAAAAVLAATDIPTGLSPCPASGPIATYIANLQAIDPVLAADVSSAWQLLQAQGATDGAIALYASDPTACAAELASTSKAKSAASVVVTFSDDGQADRAWQAGIFGFVPPAPGELPPGLNRGTTTGLGLSSWTFDRPPVRLACWHRSIFVALVVLTNLDPNAFTIAAAAVDARLH